MSAITKFRAIGIALALAIFAADQWLKYYVTKVLSLDRIGESIEIISFFNFTFTKNFGVSLGMFQAESVEMRWALVALTAFIALVVFIWMLREKLLGDILGLALILGGALGNIVDRYDLGYVVDYADLHFGEWRPFLIFNLADAAITVGVVIILARSFFLRDKAEEKDTDQPAATAVESENHA